MKCVGFRYCDKSWQSGYICYILLLLLHVYDFSVVKVFVNKNKDSVHDVNPANETPLHCACANGHFALASYLLESKAKADIR